MSRQRRPNNTDPREVHRVARLDGLRLAAPCCRVTVGLRPPPCAATAHGLAIESWFPTPGDPESELVATVAVREALRPKGIPSAMVVNGHFAVLSVEEGDDA